MELVADESIDFGIIKELRGKGILVHSISEEFTGYKDIQVLQIAIEKKCLLITEDKDFGELTHRLKLDHKGILLIRLTDIPRNERIVLAAETIEKYFNELENTFSVLTKTGLRIKNKSTF